MAYQVLENSITVNVSDEISVFPDKTTPTPDDDGVIMYYELLDLKESKSILWREKIGEGLKKHLKDVTIPKAILTDFPQGYKLYAHRKKYPKKEERTDIYLFGRHKFRSPNEFIPHLIWLVSDKSGQCHCKYCNKSATTNQSATTNEGRKVPVPFETRSKRRRDADTSDEAPRSKRMTRASSANKITDNRKRVFDDNRKRYTENQRKATDNRKKAAADNRKKNSRKSSTKKRKSKVELDINVPPPVPKYAVFREGEIVWLVVNKVLNDKTLAECNEIFSIEYWPAIVGSITPQGDNDESTIYTVKPLILHGNKNVAIDSLRPWLAYSSKESLGGNRFTRSLLNIDLDKATPDQIVEIYFKAIQKVNEIAKVFTPMYQYDYLKAKGIKEKHDGIHFKAMYFGAELIYEDDLVRLLSEDQSESADEGDKHKETKGTYLQVTSIFENKQGFQVTGDLYERDKLLEKGEYEWMPKNKMDEEYTINVSDIAGRLYPTYPDITKSFACEHLKTFENRVLMLGEDVPPTIEPNSKAAISPSTTVIPNDLDTPKRLTTKQTGKRTSPLPPILTTLKDKHPVPFSLTQNEKSNRMMGEHLEVDISEKTNTSVEIKIGDEKDIITIKQTSEVQDTKSIEKVGSPVKFSDIERRYTKKSDDIDFQPLVVSPDTPTFETDDEGDVWSKINVNNDNDSK